MSQDDVREEFYAWMFDQSQIGKPPRPTGHLYTWQAAYAAGLAARVPDGWQPIDTAPKNGKDILIFTDGVCRIGFFDVSRWSVWPGRAQALPTHWMPLPAAPKEPK